MKGLQLLSLVSALLISLSLQAQRADKNTGNIKGIIVTSDGKPAVNVSVMVPDAGKTVLSDEDGAFAIRNLQPGSHQLDISLVGYKTLTQQISVEAGKTSSLRLKLDLSFSQFEEVVISSHRNKYATTGSVDAAKLPLTNLENPQVYGAVSKELIQEQAVYSADDALKNTPGISPLWAATNRAGDGGAYFSLRGFVVQPLLRNGLSAKANNSIDAANIERLEVIKGPSGTLYGSSLTSFGGLINRVTKKPYDKFGGEVGFMTGSYDLNRVSADINTPLDSAHRALMRINTAYTNAGAFQDNGFNHSFAFDPSFVFKVNDRLTLSFDAEISHTDATTPIMFFTGGTQVKNANQLTIDYNKSYQSNDIDNTSTNNNFFALAEYKLSDHWKSQTNLSLTSTRSGGPEVYFQLQSSNDSIARNVWTSDGTTHSFEFQQNFVGDFNLGSLRNRLVAGFDVLNQQSNVRYIDPNNNSDLFDIIPTRGPIPTYNNFNKYGVDTLYQNEPQAINFTRTNTYTYGVYVSDVLNITDNLLVMASVRGDRYNNRPVADPVSGTIGTTVNQNAVSPKFGVIYQVIEQKLALFGNYMDGFTNPGYGQVYDSARGSNVTRLLKVEHAKQWEAGVKMDLFDGRLSGTLSYYDIHVSNMVFADALHNNASVQDGTEYSRGFEAEVTANPVPGFNILVGYAHNDTRLQKAASYQNGLRPGAAGPVDMGNLWASYTVPAGAVKGLGVGFGGNYAAENKVVNYTFETFTLPAYTVLNGGIFYNQSRFRVAVNMNNLTNKRYFIGFSTINPQMPRQTIASVAYRF